MPLEGEKLDELLSGFIDAELDAADLKLIVETLASDESAQKRLDELRQLSREVQQVGTQLVANATLPANFADRVLAAAKRESQASGIAAKRTSHAEDRQQTEVAKVPTWRKPLVYVGLAASVAAMWLLAAYVPHLLKPTDAVPVANGPQPAVSQQNAVARQNPLSELSTDPTEPGSVAYIGQDDFRVRYALIADVQVTKKAVREDVFGSVLAVAGIVSTQPITMNPEVEGALAETRMIVQPQEAERTEDTLLFFLRSDAGSLDTALQTIWSDRQHFPNVRLDLAIDNPESRLIEKIARSTGRRFSTNASFAAPIAASDAASEFPGGASPFPGSSATTKYVSRQSRDRGWNGSGPLAPPADRKTSMLIVLHIVD